MKRIARPISFQTIIMKLVNKSYMLQKFAYGVQKWLTERKNRGKHFRVCIVCNCVVFCAFSVSAGGVGVDTDL